MDKEIEKELSRIQLLSARYTNKLKMCPLEIKKEETRAFYIFSYIKNLRHQLENEKHLISFLEDKIKDEKLNLLNLKNNIGTSYEEIGKYKGALKAFQEVLDFVERIKHG